MNTGVEQSLAERGLGGGAGGGNSGVGIAGRMFSDVGRAGQRLAAGGVDAAIRDDVGRTDALTMGGGGIMGAPGARQLE
ncbi:MAG TPA: hypothetical protein VMZ50_05340, partial [Phycisphaerae bacterium]|nr:hypothetical protein [Phycisphaerae bacterium]